MTSWRLFHYLNIFEYHRIERHPVYDREHDRTIDWTRLTDWCSHGGAMLLVGDFDGEGFSDMLCHDVHTGYKWMILGEP